MARLLRQTEATKSRFLDSKFVRRQQRQAGSAGRASRLWYVDLDTWMASSTAVAGAGAGVSATSRAAGGAAQAAAAAEEEDHSVPADDSQVCVGLMCLC